MQIVTKVGDRSVSVGDKVRATALASQNGLCPSDTIAVVGSIEKLYDEQVIILTSENKIKGWSVSDSHDKFYYLCIGRDCLFDNFDLLSDNYEIYEDVNFKSHNLKGMHCKIIQTAKCKRHTFVELAKNVGGGSADGLGKKGHCVLVPTRSIKRSPGRPKVREWLDRAEEDGNAAKEKMARYSDQRSATPG